MKYLLQLAQESVVLQFCSLLSRLRPCTYIFRWSTVGRLNHRAAVNSRYFRSTYVKATTWPSSDKVVYHGTAYSPHCADAFLNVSFSGLYRTGVWRLRPAIVRRQRTLCGIRIKSFRTLFVSAPLCGNSNLCDPDRNQSAVVGCFERTPLCEDCDLCDQKQITANIAALRVLYHVWYGIAATEGRPQTTQPHTHTNGTRRNKKNAAELGGE